MAETCGGMRGKSLVTGVEFCSKAVPRTVLTDLARDCNPLQLSCELSPYKLESIAAPTA